MLCLTRSRICTCVMPISSYTLSNVFISIGAGFENRNFFRDDPSCPEEGEAARFVLGARGGYIAHATECKIGLALVGDSPEKSAEGHHDAFARDEPDCWIIL